MASDTLARLLRKLLPAIYADPQRARPCAACGRLLAYEDQKKDPGVVGVVCGPDCAHDVWADRAV